MVHNIVTGLGLAVLLFGLFVFFTAVLGLYRFDYVLNRMHAAAVGDALGIFCILLGLMLLHGWSLPAFKTLDTMRRCNLRLPAEDPAEAQTGLSPSLRIQDAEHTAILAALKKCCGNKAAAARMLGISYSTLWRKLKQNPADAAE